ncbi:pollen receptor-like kinase 5 [Tripterygium wilfordii]|uniref:pollen receptor-like kinase 5 n=1 Tax=Tripterygium wilfordii TaxID=458696 RepID=UPI0018F82A46|nr:pollen receptor-like kinase 5 [Tripterygium wilfordii]
MAQSPCVHGATESEILVKFKSSLSNASALNNWDGNSNSPCNWVGVRCNDDGTVGLLRLEKMSLAGLIDLDTLVGLPGLRSLSLMNNSFQGPMPAVSKLSSLKILYLSYNNFSGDIPSDAFSGMYSLKKLYMARNNFTGQIPTSLATLTKLVELVLQGNQFEGNIPDFQHKFDVLDLSNNHLEGPIPSALGDSSPAFLAGNKDLCGKPLQPCKSNDKKKKRIVILIIVVVVSLAALLVAIAAISSYFRGRQREAAAQAKMGHNKYSQKQFVNEAQSTEYPAQTKKAAQNGKLHFVRNDRERFELQDLLRASAEVLGSGSFGSSYKARLLSGSTMVVKRFRQMSNVGKEEFQEHMKRLGMLSHPNLLPLVAFYFRKEEKLLVSDFIDNGSLASHLHSNNPNPRLDWPTRLKIIRGVARGLAYLFKQFPNTALPHGHLKSSNVLVDDTFEPILTDYALFPVVNRDLAQQVMVAYKSPDERKNRKTDVWSLGILILEMLTGKFPANYLKQGSGSGANGDLGTWVNSVVREEWTGEVFDKEMRGGKNGEGEMLKLLKIGMCCCESNVERRWDLREAVEKIEELKERDGDYDDMSSYGSEGDVYSSRAMTEDDFSFSVNGS